MKALLIVLALVACVFLAELTKVCVLSLDDYVLPLAYKSGQQHVVPYIFHALGIALTGLPPYTAWHMAHFESRVPINIPASFSICSLWRDIMYIHVGENGARISAIGK